MRTDRAQPPAVSSQCRGGASDRELGCTPGARKWSRPIPAFLWCQRRNPSEWLRSRTALKPLGQA
eukprot:scaffold55646_cov29-Tisochrysis_lutea.AAC.2